MLPYGKSLVVYDDVTNTFCFGREDFLPFVPGSFYPCLPYIEYFYRYSEVSEVGETFFKLTHHCFRPVLLL